MNRYSVFTIVLAISTWMFLGYSCNNKSSDASLNLLADQVMEVHDEVMPKMGTIHQLKRKLSSKSAEVLDSETENQSQMLQEIAKHQSALEAAEDQMMEWMHNFDKDWSAKTNDEAKLYLQNEKKRIDGVKTAMLESIANVEKFLEE